MENCNFTRASKKNVSSISFPFELHHLAAFPDRVGAKPLLTLDSHHGPPGGGPHLLCVLLAVLRPARAALLAHLLQDLPGPSAPILHRLLHLMAPPSVPEVPKLSQCDRADPVGRRRPADQRVPASHC